MKTKVLVTGANGQLGQCLQVLSKLSSYEFSFYDSSTLDVSSEISIKSVFNKSYDFCINCAAYTAVDKAEAETNKAKNVNTIGAHYLANACLENDVVLIHISTDYVFDGTKNSPYKTDDDTMPLSVYGQTKRDGEEAIIKILSNYFIIRTSWLYSAFGDNFVKSMLRLSKTKNSLNVVNDQTSAPTNAMVLAKAILVVIKENKNYGIYHFSNLGQASWYEFAQLIFDLKNIDINLNAIPSSAYPTAAKRPFFSVLDTSKFMKNFNYQIPHWQESLTQFLNKRIN